MVPDRRREAMDPPLMEPVLAELLAMPDLSQHASREEAVEWIRADAARRGRALFEFVLARWGDLPTYMTDERHPFHHRFGFPAENGWHVQALWTEAVLALAEHPELPSWNLRIFAAIPKRRMAESQLRVLLRAVDWDVVWAGVKEGSLPHRGLLISALDSAGRLTTEQAVRGLENSALRGACAKALGARMPEVFAAILPLAQHTNAPTRKAAVKLLRIVEPTFGMDTLVLSSSTPTLHVLADQLGDQGNPHGELLALSLGIEQAEPTRALELSVALASHVETHREALWGQPGGFPPRENYRGRQFIQFTSAWNHRMRGKGGKRMLERVEAFLAHLAVAVEKAPARPQVDPSWTFQWAHPGTGIPLPFQESGHYPSGRALQPSLSVDPRSGRLMLRFPFPFEQRTPEFASYLAECEATLGRVFTSSGWTTQSPNAKGTAHLNRHGYLPLEPNG